MNKISSIMMTLLIFSALSIGSFEFISGTASQYTVEATNLEQFTQHFNATSYVDARLKEIQQKLESFSPTNPLTWGNFVQVIINVFDITLTLPAQFQSIITYMAENIFFIPSWVVPFIEIAVLLVIIFAAISSLNKAEV